MLDKNKDSHLPDDKFYASGNCEFTGYKIEVRVKHFNPSRVAFIADRFYGQIVLTKEWQEVHYLIANDPNKVGIPLGDAKNQEFFVLPKESAVALGFTIIAQASFPNDVEVRIVPIKTCYTYSQVRKEEDAIILNTQLGL